MALNRSVKIQNRKLMDRRFLLAAELHSYSYANYDNHLGIGNFRYDVMMPHDIDVLEQAKNENWPNGKIADELEIEEDEVDDWKARYNRAKDIIEAPDAAESFRRAVRHSILLAISEGLNTEQDIEGLVEQICYRASDFSYLLDLEGKTIADYSDDLRH